MVQVFEKKKFLLYMLFWHGSYNTEEKKNL